MKTFVSIFLVPYSQISRTNVVNKFPNPTNVTIYSAIGSYRQISLSPVGFKLAFKFILQFASDIHTFNRSVCQCGIYFLCMALLIFRSHNVSLFNCSHLVSQARRLNTLGSEFLVRLGSSDGTYSPTSLSVDDQSMGLLSIC